MFTKESLYINAVKYDTQLKLDYKKLNNDEIVQTNNSVFLVDDDILPLDIAHKLNASQKEIPNTFISTLLVSDTTKLVPKDKSSKLTDCEIAQLNSEYDIAVLKTTLFETKNYFEKTGIDYIYSAFHIMNLHLEQNICKNELLMFLFNNKAFILILNESSSIVYNKTVDLPTFDSIKKTHFYEDDISGQKLFDEIYYLELNEIIHNTLNKFYETKNNVFIEKVTLLYSVKQLSNELIEQLAEELILKVDYHPINIDEEIFELSKDKHLKKSFVKPRKKKKKTNYNSLFIFVFFVLAFLGIFKLYTNIKTEKIEDNNSISKVVELPDHVNENDKIEQRVRAILDTISYDIILKEIKINKESLDLKGTFLKDDTFITSLKPSLEKLYEVNDFTSMPNEKKVSIDGEVISKDLIELSGITYKTYDKKYITDEFMPISRVTEQLRILMPENAIIKFKSSKNEDITKFYYMVNIVVKSPIEFFNLIDMLNNELYSISIEYPISMLRTINGIEVEFNLVFNQPK